MSTKTLDHIVFITPPGSREETVERWKALGFKVTPGGRHADGLTENALVILSDASYVELISFTHPPEDYPVGSPERAVRDAHLWGKKGPGWIDFSFLGFGLSNVAPSTSSGGSEAEVDLAKFINARSANEGSGVEYEPTVTGGRLRADGAEIRWQIAAPNAAKHGRGVLPFYLGDLTERGIRVPVSEDTTVHPNTVKGVAQLRLFTPPSAYHDIVRQITTTFGAPPVASSQTESSWELETPGKASVAGNALQAIPAPKLVLRVAEEQSGQTLGAGEIPGIKEVAFWVEKGRVNEAATLPHEGIVWLELE
ncbi:hypothetical protein M0805_006414 [Coniferiporia weirii]|nr:hypothetical protein M0805_006414 [Coniferiporia weirii]